MCSIFGSFDKDEFFQLAQLNLYRGSHSHSIAVYNPVNGDLNIIQKEFGPLEKIDLPDDCYYIGHQQAPTTDAKDVSAIHPAFAEGVYLWHNGIIKQHQVDAWKREYNSPRNWDTEWLATLIAGSGFDVLNTIDGSFACLMYNPTIKKLLTFRNDNCPLHTNSSSISSTAFTGSSNIQSGVVYMLNKGVWEQTSDRFSTSLSTFYWIPE